MRTRRAEPRIALLFAVLAAGVTAVLLVATNEGAPHVFGGGNTHADRVQEALGNMFMDITCSNCGSSKVIRAGACGCCTECGTSQGCS